MKAELRQLDDAGDLEALVRGFETAFTLFCDEEMALFVNARRLENDEITRAAFAAKARALAESFEPWLGRFHTVVLRRREANDGGLTLALLHTCGAQLIDANQRFAAAVASCAD